MSVERAFCQNKEHVPAFRAYGLPDKLIYVDGRGAASALTLALTTVGWRS